jgi:hypothetical protein
MYVKQKMDKVYGCGALVDRACTGFEMLQYLKYQFLATIKGAQHAR